MAEAADSPYRLTVLREVNDFVLGLQLRFGAETDERVGFLCECEDSRCTALVLLTCCGYEAIRSDGGHVLARGHVYEAA